MSDEEEQVDLDVTLDPAMMWGTRISPDEFRVYVNESDYFTVNLIGATALVRALQPFVDGKE